MTLEEAVRRSLEAAECEPVGLEVAAAAASGAESRLAANIERTQRIAFSESPAVAVLITCILTAPHGRRAYSVTLTTEDGSEPSERIVSRVRELLFPGGLCSAPEVAPATPGCPWVSVGLFGYRSEEGAASGA